MAATGAKSVRARVESDGRIAIPDGFLAELEIGEDAVVRLTLVDGELRLQPVSKAEQEQGSYWFKELYDSFAPARAEAIEKGYTEEQINEWIDQAVAEVRARHG